MCNELQVAAFQISRAETDLTPGRCFSRASIQVARHRRITMRKAQRPPLQRGVHGCRRAKCAGSNRPLRHFVGNNCSNLVSPRGKNIRDGWPLRKFMSLWGKFLECKNTRYFSLIAHRKGKSIFQGFVK